MKLFGSIALCCSAVAVSLFTANSFAGDSASLAEENAPRMGQASLGAGLNVVAGWKESRFGERGEYRKHTVYQFKFGDLYKEEFTQEYLADIDSNAPRSEAFRPVACPQGTLHTTATWFRPNEYEDMSFLDKAKFSNLNWWYVELRAESRKLHDESPLRYDTPQSYYRTVMAEPVSQRDREWYDLIHQEASSKDMNQSFMEAVDRESYGNWHLCVSA